VATKPKDVSVPELLANTIRQLPGFEPFTETWDEPGPEDSPAIGVVFAGAVEDVEVSVIQFRSGGLVQLMFAFAGEDELEPDGYVFCVVAWLWPSVGSEMPDKDGRTVSPMRIEAKGLFNDILDHQLLLRLVGQADELLSGSLLGDRRHFMALDAEVVWEVDDPWVSLPEQEVAGSAFLRQFICGIATATS
jgi:hypothetical protein